MSRASTRRAAPLAALLVAGALAGALALGLDAHAPLELWTLDARFRLRGPTAPVTSHPSGARGVALVALDDKTLREAPELAQRRAGVARLLEAVRAQGARVIGVDAFFAEPEAPLPPALASDVAAYVADEGAMRETPARAAALLRDVRAETQGDEALEQALGDDVVLAVHASPEGAALDEDARRKGRYGQVGAGDAAIAPAPRLIGSLPRFTKRAGAVGLVTVELDEDQVGRRLAAARVHEGAVLAPLAVHVAARALGVPPARVGYLPGSHLVLGGARADLVTRGSGDALQLDFRGPRGTFPTYSAVDVVTGRVPDGALRDRAVLVGFTYLSHDVSPTPFDGGAPGLEVHATAVDNLLAGDALKRTSPLVDAAWALALGLLCAALYTRAGPRRASLRVALSLAIVALALAAAHALFVTRGLWLAAAGPALTALAASATALVVAYATEGAERRRLRKAFAHYLADEVIDELMQNPHALALGGAKRDVTLLFSDIRGFTSLSEKRTPVELAQFLNRYLTPMTRAVLAERGFLDKYIGDALMAVFGAPAPSTDHPERACATALRMHAALVELRRTLDPALDIGVGINTGEAVAGNMGSDERFDYTVIGDSVNLASRLESLTKRYGVFCIVGDDTRKRVPADAPYTFREIDLVRVKGRAAPVAIHELVVTARDPAFAAGVAHWRAGRFAEARAVFAPLAAAPAPDPVAALYVARIDGMREVPAAWDGVFDHDEK